MRHDELELELALWRAAGLHRDVGPLATALLAILGPYLPRLTGLVLWRLCESGSLLRTAATRRDGGEPVISDEARPAEPALMDALRQWLLEGEVRRGRLIRGPLRALVSAPPGGSATLLVAVEDAEGPLGVACLELHGAERASEGDVAIAERLREPLAAALRTLAQVRSLRVLHAASEARGRELLSRLDRVGIAEAVVGADAGLREVMSHVEQVAPGSTPVLLLGETGAGKEVIAWAIHRQSARAAGPMVRVNCGAIPTELVDSELFGHERGAFTGASSARQGWFERADGGTLLLDEVGELPLAAQVRLLRVLQDGSFQRVGGVETRTADVRVVAATNRDLVQMVRRGEFREDLWYRLSVYPIRLPPLRERPADIPALARFFAIRTTKRLWGVPVVPSESDIRLLLMYDWPGNARELSAVMERAAILGDGHSLQVAAALGMSRAAAVPTRSEQEHQPGGGLGASPVSALAGPPPRETGAPAATAPLSLDEAMAQRIHEALVAARGRIEGRDGAARLLGINPSTLRSRMQKLGLDWRRYRG